MRVFNYLTFATSNWNNVLARQTAELDYIQTATSFFKTVSILTENDLSDNWHKKYDNFTHIRGYSLWAWKPYIIYNKLLEIGDNEFLLYADSGCVFPKENQLTSFLTILDAIAANATVQKLQIAVEPAGTIPVYKVIRKQILEKFELENDKEFLYRSPHYEAGILLIQKTPSTLNFIKSWMQFFEDHFEDSIVSEYLDKTGQVQDFIQNNGDQSVLQCLLWKVRGTFFSIPNLIYYRYGFYARQRN